VIARLAVVAALALTGLAVLTGGVAGADRAPAPGESEAAAGAHTLAILAVEASSRDVARAFESELESQLGALRVRFLPRARLREQMRGSTQWTEGCVVGTCLAEVRAQTGAGVVLLAALTGSGTTFGYVVTLVRTDTGRVLAQDAARCDVCTESEATGRALAAAVKLVGAIPPQLPDEAAEQGAAVEVAVNASNRKRAADRRGVRRVGWALTIFGLAAAGTGAFLYLAGDDRPAYGLAAAAGGGGLAVGGITVLAF
jgi:hypothetical protein